MPDLLQAMRPAALDLPPAFQATALPGEADVFARAREIAPERGAGALLWADAPDMLELAVVLEPAEPLRTARRAFLVGMEALAVALGRVAPPEKPLLFDWPDAIRFDGGLIGGGRLAWPDGCDEDETPAWLVFGGTLFVSVPGGGEPGLRPDLTSLAEEGFEREDQGRLVEAFARHLLWAFDRWATQGFEAVAADYLARLPQPVSGARAALAPNGDLLGGAEPTERRCLRTALLRPAFLDRARTERPW